MFANFIMAAILYHSVEPENNAVSYSEFSTADFVLTGENRKLVAGSVRLEGRIAVTKTGVGEKTQVLIAANTGHWKIDNMLGLHSICESITTEVQSAGNIEHLASYPRYVKMVAASSKDANDMMDADMVVEGRGPVGSNGEYAIEPVAALNTDAGGGGVAIKTKDPAFSLKLLHCLNRMSADYSFDKYGYAKISINFARANQLIFGTDCDSNMSYALSDLRLSYKTIPEDGVMEKVLMRSYFSTKSTIQSQSASIQSRVPSDSVLGVSISFLKQSNEGDPVENAQGLEKLPNIEQVRYLFSDTENRFVSYSIDSTSDLLDRGIKSLKYSGHTAATQLNLKNNDGFIAGVDFPAPVSLRNQKFTASFDTTSTSLSGSPYLCYLYFHTILQL